MGGSSSATRGQKPRITKVTKEYQRSSDLVEKCYNERYIGEDKRHAGHEDKRHAGHEDKRHAGHEDERHAGHEDERHEDEKHEEELISEFVESSFWTYEEKKFYDPGDTTLTFVEKDDLDILFTDYKSLRAQMSCGHGVTPTSLTNWCRYLLYKGDYKFECAQTDCSVKWPFEEVCKMALLTPEEIEDFEKEMFQNAAKDFIKCCPGCNSRVMRSDLHNLSVECTVCTAEKRRPYIFCWRCLKKWKGPAWSENCGNVDCQNPLEILKSCPAMTFKDVKGVTGCPSIRACPTCGLLLEHNRSECKNIFCLRCKVQFCFVCLKLTEDCVDEANITTFFNLCSSGVAPRQTSMPVWQRT